jgi:hypothetical protein
MRKKMKGCPENANGKCDGRLCATGGLREKIAVEWLDLFA